MLKIGSSYTKMIVADEQTIEKIATCAVRFYNYTTKLGAQIQ